MNSIGSITAMAAGAAAATTAAPVHYNPIPGLNDDSLLHIMDFCSQKDICRLKKSCRYLRDLGSYYQMSLAKKFPLAALGVKDAKATTLFLQSLGAYRATLVRLNLSHIQMKANEFLEEMKVPLPNLKELKPPRSILHSNEGFVAITNNQELLLDIAIQTKCAELLYVFALFYQENPLERTSPVPFWLYKNKKAFRFIELVQGAKSKNYKIDALNHVFYPKCLKYIGLTLIVKNLKDETLSCYKELSQYLPVCLDVLKIDVITNSSDRIEKELPSLERLKYCELNQQKIPCIKTLKTLHAMCLTIAHELVLPNLEELFIEMGGNLTKIILAKAKKVRVTHSHELVQVIAPLAKYLMIQNCYKMQHVVTCAKRVSLFGLHQLQSVVIEENTAISFHDCHAFNEKNIKRLKREEVLALLNSSP
jgi:hypothetical protein